MVAGSILVASFDSWRVLETKSECAQLRVQMGVEGPWMLFREATGRWSGALEGAERGPCNDSHPGSGSENPELHSEVSPLL